MAEKTLYILRHAKTEPLTHGQEDRERVLAERGVNEAKNFGKYMLSSGIKPQLVWCSSAMRTRQTWQHVQAVCGETMPVHYDDALYHVTMPDMLSMLKRVPEKTQSLMWIGHNPGLHELCVRLALDGDHGQRVRLSQKFPPCSFVELRFDGEWKDIDQLVCRLEKFITPGDI